jgi:two-component system chemotaxis response regulator CheB
VDEAAAKRVRVLVVDDSALARQVLTEILRTDPAIQVVGVAFDPIQAFRKIRELAPDVLTLDVDMPHMDGLTFLERLMRLAPMPVVMCSAFTAKGAATTLAALEAGAVDFVAKPSFDLAHRTADMAAEIRAKVKAAARARLRVGARAAGTASAPAAPGSQSGSPAPVARPRGQPARLIAIGASTGGTEALRVVLGALDADTPGVVVVQHMPATFTRAFAERLDACCRVRVREARDGDAVVPGHVLVAPGGLHMRVVHRGGAIFVALGR